MFYKMFFFFEKHFKTVKLYFTGYFPEALLACFKVSETFYTCFLLKVYKNFPTCFLALLCFSLKFYKAFLKSLALRAFKTFLKSLALKVYKTFYKHGSLGSTACFKIKTGAWAQPFALKSPREPRLNRSF